MKRFSTLSLVVALAACGWGEPANNDAASQPASEAPAAAPAADPAVAAPSGEMTMPDWFSVDDAAKTVHMTITAGLTDAGNYWNFNGARNGDMAITVPEGYAVTIDFKNNDPSMGHSLGIIAKTSNFGANVQPDPVFEGAITSNPTDMMNATMPGQDETVSFTASQAGQYSMVCFIPGHAATGMWIHFNVSSDGTSGVQGGPS
jgi:sulfocyanin